jgi:nucleotide-binding universal stress UspA family protein
MPDTNVASPPFVLLVAIDSSPQTDAVIAYAAALARGRAGAVLHVVHVVAPPVGVSVTPLATAYASTLAGQRELLDGQARAAQVASGASVVGHLREGDPWRCIVQTAASIDADLVVLGTRDRQGVARLVMGSVAEKVMRHAECPVLVVREKAHHATRAPEIEPPCPDCVRTQHATNGSSLWCARHLVHHPRPHLHHAADDAFGTASTLDQT